MFGFPEYKGENTCSICGKHKVIVDTDWCFSCREQCEEENATEE